MDLFVPSVTEDQLADRAEEALSRAEEALSRTEAARADWRDVTIDLCETLFVAREKIKNDIEFSSWFNKRKRLSKLSRNTRRALIKMGEHIEATKEWLLVTKKDSWRRIWDDEMRERVHHPVQPRSLDNDETNGSNNKETERADASNKFGRFDAEGLAKLFDVAETDIEDMVRPYPGRNRRNALRALLVQLLDGERSKTAARELMCRAIKTSQSGQAPTVGNTYSIDVRMFWPNIPEAIAKRHEFKNSEDLTPIIKVLKNSKNRHRLDDVNAKAKEGKSVEELVAIWNPDLVLPARRSPDVVGAGVRVTFCGETIWPRRDKTDGVTFEDVEAAWWFCRGEIAWMESAKAQKSPEVAIQLRRWTSCLAKASSVRGLVKAIEACVNAYAVNGTESFWDTERNITPRNIVLEAP